MLLFQRFSIPYCITATIALTVLLGSALIRENRSLTVIARALADGAKLGAQIAVVLALVGILAQAAITTGLAPKASSAILSLTEGMFLPTIALIAMVAIILGMGLPVTAAYLIIAITMLPSVFALGVDQTAAHFFTFYIAAWAAVSPPVAPAALVASRLAAAPFWRTGLTALKFLATVIVYPFAIVVHPSLLQITALGWWEVGIFGLLLLSSLLISVTVFGWAFSMLTHARRVISGASALSILGFVLAGGQIWLLIGLALLAVLVLMQTISAKALVQRSDKEAVKE